MAGLIHLLCVKSYVDLTKVLRPNHYCRGRRMKGWVRVDVGTSFLRPEPSNEFPVSIDTQTDWSPADVRREGRRKCNRRQRLLPPPTQRATCVGGPSAAASSGKLLRQSVTDMVRVSDAG
jgi:hypothetical protein